MKYKDFLKQKQKTHIYSGFDIEYKDLTIKEGTTIHLLTIPAGSDPRKFENNEFDITAERAPHFGFGGGMHHCIGHYVARLDMKEAFKALSARLPNMQVAPGDTYLPDSGNTGPTKLVITFQRYLFVCIRKSSVGEIGPNEIASLTLTR